MRLLRLLVSAPSRLVRVSWSCWALTCNGPLASQPVIAVMVSASCARSAGTPRTKVITTRVRRPPSTANPPTSTTAVATPRGVPRRASRSTAGASRAASSTAMATGTTTAASPATIVPSTYSAAATASSRQLSAAATCSGRGITAAGSRRTSGVAPRAGGGAGVGGRHRCRPREICSSPRHVHSAEVPAPAARLPRSGVRNAYGATGGTSGDATDRPVAGLASVAPRAASGALGARHPAHHREGRALSRLHHSAGGDFLSGCRSAPTYPARRRSGRRSCRPSASARQERDASEGRRGVGPRASAPAAGRAAGRGRRAAGRPGVRPALVRPPACRTWLAGRYQMDESGLVRSSRARWARSRRPRRTGWYRWAVR